MEREACVCDHGFERSDLCAEIVIIIMTIEPISLSTAAVECSDESALNGYLTHWRFVCCELLSYEIL